MFGAMKYKGAIVSISKYIKAKVCSGCLRKVAARKMLNGMCLHCSGVTIHNKHSVVIVAERLYTLIMDHKRQYYILDDPSISDYEYDMLEQHYELLETYLGRPSNLTPGLDPKWNNKRG